MPKIIKIKGRQVFDSRGNPTVEAEVYLDNGSSELSICPSGASTGSFEAYEKRDKTNKKYLGKSVLNTVEIINNKISKSLKGQNPNNQKKIDSILIDLDGTEQKKRFGANSILPVSMAVKKLSAKNKKIPLFKDFIIKNNFTLPFPLMNVINGGEHANNKLRIQEFMIRPDGAKKFSESLQMCFLVINNLKSILHKKNLSTSVGDEGGFAPMISSNEQALEMIIQAITKSGYKNGKDISICLDIAANELCKVYKKKWGNVFSYSVKSNKYENWLKVLDYYLKLIKKYKVKSIEDPFSENHIDGWSNFLQQTIHPMNNFNVQIVGDDLFATNLKRLQLKGIIMKGANSILIKPNQIGTVSETLEVIKEAKDNNFKTIISHRSGDTEDIFIADLAVGTGSGQIKTGSLARSERVAKYNRLLRIEEELGKHAKMANI